MKNTKNVLWPTVAILVASAGLANAQNDRRPSNAPAATPPSHAAAPRGDTPTTMRAQLFDKVSRVRGYDVVNSASETVGSIEDLIIDRGSGRTDYVLIKSGGLLGLGGKTIAVPYHRLSTPNINDRRFMIDMSKEEAEQAAAFVPENWSELKRDSSWADRMHTQWNDRNADDRNVDSRNDPDTDPTATAIAAAMEEALGGEVVAVKREWTGRDDNVVVEVRTNDGKVRDLQMGPSWWVMSQPGAPMRGDKVDAKVRVITRDGANPRYVVSNATVDGKTLVLRDSQFRPAWDVTDGAKTDDARRGAARAVSSRLVLASDIEDAKAVALDKDSADIEDAVIDLNSGTVVALIVDPNDSTLGWGDTKRLIPWSATTYGTDDKVHIDADQKMLTSATEVPDDLNATPWATAVYTNFGMPAPRYERSWNAPRADRRTDRPDDRNANPNRNNNNNNNNNNNVRDDSWTLAALSGQPTSFSGTVSRPRNEGIGKSNAEVVIVTLTNGGRTEEIVIAPPDYAKGNDLAFKDGDQVEITGRTMILDGKRYIVAQKITRNGRTTDIWTGDKPAWNKR